VKVRIKDEKKMNKGLPPLPSPGGYEQAYAVSYDLAFEKLRQADLADICLKSGAVQVGADAVRLRLLNREYLVDRLLGRVILHTETEPVPISEGLLILHYLVTASGAPPRGEWIAFKDLPDGRLYDSTFYKRTVKLLLRKFGDSPAKLAAAALKIGGIPVEMGDAAVTVQAFPKVPVTWVLWQGNDEFPAEGSVLLDRGISDYLPTEDIVVLCQTIALRLCYS
jgi:hypothetical protein